MDLNDKCPISKQIDNIDETITELTKRIANLKKKLALIDPESSERKTLTHELAEIEKLVATHETLLKDLRKNNRKSFVFVGIFVLLLFVMYLVYVAIVGI